MSGIAPPPTQPQIHDHRHFEEPPPRPRDPRRKRIIIAALAIAAVVAAGYFALRQYRSWSADAGEAIPVAKVQRSDISFNVTAKGDLRGGNPETLMAPATGGTELHLTYLGRNGDQVRAGDVVASFDTAEQQYKLKEAQADVAEAEQKILQSQAQRDAQREEDQYALIKARNDLRLAELEVRKDPLLPTITARQNVLALDSAREHLRQVQQNLGNRVTTGDAGIAKETAGRLKAASQAKTARENIEAMTLRAKRAGYISVKQNTSTNFGYMGMVLPDLQVGDSVRPGMAIVEIPDLEHWEVSASVAEIDRGHIQPGDAVTISLVALPGRTLRGHVSNLGGTVGNFWERHFECIVALDEKSEALRPGMSAELVIATDALRNALSVPAQALFESQGAAFVYLASGNSFARKDVKLIRRNETRAVVSGLSAGQTVALANPLERKEKKAPASTPLKAGPR